MPLPSVEELRELTKKYVLKANVKGELYTLTPKLLRRDLEQQLDLEEGDLDEVDYRNVVKETIKETLENLPPSEVPEEEMNEETEGTKEKKCADKTTTTTVTTTKVKTKKQKADIKNVEDVPTKKPRAKKEKKQDSNTEPPAKETKTKTKKAVKKSILVSDDDGSVSGEASDPEEPGTKPPPQKRRRVAPARTEGSEDEEDIYMDLSKSKSKNVMSEVDIEEPLSKESKMELDDKEEQLPQQPTNQEVEDHPKSESEMSVLIDELPKPKRKRKEKDTKTDKPKATKGRSKPTTTLTKDEETIKRLKSLVLACGVRKVWSKLFQGLDTPSQQIKKLKEILHDLGMSGRMSLEQAKSIRAKRELEQELQDVQEFEKAITRTSRRKSQPKAREESNEGEQESVEEENPKPKRLKNARQSIMAFLGDQSSDDD